VVTVSSATSRWPCAMRAPMRHAENKRLVKRGCSNLWHSGHAVFQSTQNSPGTIWLERHSGVL
jgi:hypothetical protein